MPWAIANASYKQQQDNDAVTEIVEIKDRGHALTIDHGWREVAETALAFVEGSRGSCSPRPAPELGAPQRGLISAVAI
jgi:hypothetical protein